MTARVRQFYVMMATLATLTSVRTSRMPSLTIVGNWYAPASSCK
jgi:hypothetical protein